MSKKWCFMVYMAANNSLSSAADRDLAELASVGSDRNVDILVFVKRAMADGSAEAKRMKIVTSGPKLVQDLGDVDSGDPQTVTSFIDWASATSDADRQAFVLWNHGGGWRSDQLEDVVGFKSALNEDTLARSPLSQVIFTSALRQIERAGAMREAIVDDDGTGHAIDTPELGSVLSHARRAFGKPIELFGMDACQMSNLEVVYELRGNAELVVSSEEEEPNGGWPYSDILRSLSRNPSMSGQTLARTIVRKYSSHYKIDIRDHEASEFPSNRRKTARATQSAASPGELESLTTAMDELCEALLQSDHVDAEMFEKSRMQSLILDTYRHEKSDLVDLNAFCSALVRLAGADRPVGGAAARIREALTSSVILAEAHVGNGMRGWGGLSVYAPPWDQPISRFYKDLKFAKRHRWLDVLTRFRS